MLATGVSVTALGLETMKSSGKIQKPSFQRILAVVYHGTLPPLRLCISRRIY